MRGVLVVFAKRPEPGFVKTRLCPPLRPEQAAELYACMLDDVLVASARAAPALGLEPVLAAIGEQGEDERCEQEEGSNGPRPPEGEVAPEALGGRLGGLRRPAEVIVPALVAEAAPARNRGPAARAVGRGEDGGGHPS